MWTNSTATTQLAGYYNIGSMSWTLVMRLMAQLAVEAGETAETDSIQAAFRDLLGEFGQRPERAAESKEKTPPGMLAAFCHRRAEMLGKARARLAHNPRHTASPPDSHTPPQGSK